VSHQGNFPSPKGQKLGRSLVQSFYNSTRWLDRALEFSSALQGGPRTSSQSSSAKLQSFRDTELAKQTRGIAVVASEKFGQKDGEAREVAVFIDGEDCW
jgi:hypothetical protein